VNRAQWTTERQACALCILLGSWYLVKRRAWVSRHRVERTSIRRGRPIVGQSCRRTRLAVVIESGSVRCTAIGRPSGGTAAVGRTSTPVRSLRDAGTRVILLESWGKRISSSTLRTGAFSAASLPGHSVSRCGRRQIYSPTMSAFLAGQPVATGQCRRTDQRLCRNGSRIFRRMVSVKRHDLDVHQPRGLAGRHVARWKSRGPLRRMTQTGRPVSATPSASRDAAPGFVRDADEIASLSLTGDDREMGDSALELLQERLCRRPDRGRLQWALTPIF